MKPASSSPLGRLNGYPRRALLTLAAFSAFSVAVPRAAPTQEQPRPRLPLADPIMRAVASDSLKIFLLTMGQGDEVYELFGHNALWVHDPAQPIDTVYNWGVFSFDEPHFVFRFLKGEMRYSMIGDPLGLTLEFYQSLNREVWGQELNLTDSEKKALVDFVRWNSRPENSKYRYDYYLDNCSTRVRDAIDRATGGQVRPQLKAIKTTETYRSHSLRLMQGMRAMVSGVELLLGRPTDVKLSADETSFLPVQLMTHLRAVRLDGGKRPLFKEDFVVSEASRPPEPTQVPKLWLWFLPISIALVGFVVWLGASLRRGRRRRIAAFAVSFLAAVLGILGTIITGLVTLTDHTAAHGNENFFLLNPFWLAIAVLAPMIVLRPRPRPVARRVIALAVGLACVALLSHVVGLSRQSNWDAILLILPVELAIGWVLLWAARIPATSVTAS